MKTVSDWNPEQYLKFRNERTQPSIDLVARINLEAPAQIADIGCGPGNSTQVLAGRWPRSRTTGIDNSPAMIEKARKDYPDREWILGNALELDRSRTYDLVFSNATIQWIPEHEKLVDTMFSVVNRGGALAVQVPLFMMMPVHGAFEEAAAERWSDETRDVAGLFTYHEPGFYFDLLSKIALNVEMWVTDYFHIMDSHEGILDMMRSTGMRPYLDRIGSEEERGDFESLVLGNLRRVYHAQQDGKVIFPFKRLFFIAYK